MIRKLLLPAFLVFCITFSHAQLIHNIIPQPNTYQVNSGIFTLNKSTVINCNVAEFNQEINYFNATLARTISFFPLNKGFSGANVITIEKDNDISNAEGYKLQITDNEVKISASTTKGVFYAMQSFFQLLPPVVFGKEKLNNPNIKLQACSIVDQPRFTYRGMHLDVSRHFFSVQFIKQYIDYLAMYKMNTFHWHLTDDQGWRIEIKKYPKLQTIAAFRDETLEGHYNRIPRTYDKTPYGGYYTQAQVKEIVAYASMRHVTIIPEIEMPGHAMAALAAYPEYSCTGGPFKTATIWGVFDDVFCAKEETFTFIEDVLSEVAALFPGQYIHIGGDECPKNRWEACPNCKAVMAKNELRDAHQLQSYFITRVEKFLKTKGKKIIGWDEILEGGLAPDATVMSWRGIEGGIAAAKLKHDVIMTPGGYCYFDHYQSQSPSEPVSIGGFTSVKKVYSFEPVPEILNADEAKYILGAQGNVWTEYMDAPEVVEYKIFPRIAALSEVNWTLAENKNWENFSARLQHQFLRYDAMLIPYSKQVNDVVFNAQYDSNNKALIYAMTTSAKGNIKYTLDGQEPTINSLTFTDKLAISKETVLKAAVFDQNKLVSNISEENISWHKAIGIQPKFNYEPSSSYKGNGAATLSDGVRGNNKFGDGKWLGFIDNNLEAVYDFVLNKTVSSVEISYLVDTGPWIFEPSAFEVYTSVNGMIYKRVASLTPVVSTSSTPAGPATLKASFNPENIRFVKVVVKNLAQIPNWHGGSGRKAWIFVDEIIIN